MRKIIVLSFITLDGVMQAPGCPEEDRSGNFKYGGWVAPYFDAESGKIMAKQMAGTYDLLIGRKTYDIFARYWPQHIEGWPQVNKITKYVASKTLKNPGWQNTVVIENDAELKRLKESDGPTLQVHGSGQLVQTLLQLDLVDELWLKIYPILLGTGKKLFNDGSFPAAFTLKESIVTTSGIVVTSYKRAGEVETGTIDS